MKAREKLENLTLLWIVYSVVVSAVMLLLRGGFGFWSIVASAVGLLISVGIHVAIGRALLNRNRLIRGLVLLLATLGTGLAALGIVKEVLLFFATFSLALFWPLLGMAVVIAMNVHSLRVLLSPEVRRYFR